MGRRGPSFPSGRDFRKEERLPLRKSFWERFMVKKMDVNEEALPEEEVEGLGDLDETLPKEMDISELAPDVPIKLVAVLGKKRMTLNELLKMKKGEVVDLNRPPSEIVDLMANGQMVGQGELVEIDGKFGVRILKLLK